ncbi:MAG TPA: hypothetical protein VFA23_14890 [Dongiaceae bacterium]|nr:hypothetical protein [Dongiaceae bacterium]
MHRSALVVAMVLALSAECGAQSLTPPGSTAGPAAGGDAGGLPVPPGSDQPYKAKGDELLKKLTARQFDRRLPDLPLADWFSGLLGKRAQIEWTTGECGDEGGGPDPGAGQSGAGQGDDTGGTPGSNLDATLCTEGQALFYGADGKPSLDRYVVLQLWVGTRRNGVNLDAASYGPDAVSVFVFDGKDTRTLSRLGDLPPTLSALN